MPISTPRREKSGAEPGLARFLTPRQSHRRELLDQADQPKEALAGTFRDLYIINRWFGGWELVDKCLRPFLPASSGPHPVRLRLLDLASGAADLPIALAQRWRKRGIELHVTAIDLNPTIVELAHEAAGRHKLAHFEAVAGDVFEYPWPPGQRYDFVTCSLAFHHFPPEQCVEMLRLMSRLCGRAFVVNDLRRSWWGWLGAKALTYTITRHPLNRHDAPLSILRAFTRQELADLVEKADLGPDVRVEVRQGRFSRLALVGYHCTAE